jgi:ricin-type beta-trefoil lectin protein
MGIKRPTRWALSTLLGIQATVAGIIVGAAPAPAVQELWYDQVALASRTRLVVDVRDGSLNNGSDVWLWGFHGDRNQSWLLNPRPNARHTWEIKASHSKRCLDVEGVSQAEFARVQQWDCNGWDNQGWIPELLRNDGWGYPIYRLRAVHSGLCLDAPTDVPEWGAKLRQARCNGGAGQEWTLNHPLSNPATGRVMDVWGMSTGNNAPVWLWNFEAGRNQYWYRAPTADGFATQARVLHSGKCLDTEGSALSIGTKLVQWQCDGRRTQRWQFEVSRWDNYRMAIYRIRSDGTNLCAAVTPQPDSLGARLRLETCNNGASQEWRF